MSAPTLTVFGNASRRFADPACLPGTRLRHDQVVAGVPFHDPRSGQPARPSDFRQRRALVLAFLHDRCPACADWADSAAEAVDGRPDAELRVIAPRVGPRPGQRLLWLDRGDHRGQLLTAPDTPAVLILDRYAAVQEAAVADDHRLPAPDEVTATLEHLAIRCPECSV